MVETCNRTIFQILISTTEESGELVVLIDAYNLCGKWEKLRPDFKSGRLSIARDKLISSLIMYSELRGFFYLLELYSCTYAVVSAI